VSVSGGVGEEVARWQSARFSARNAFCKSGRFRVETEERKMSECEWGRGLRLCAFAICQI
jgi:hypothetical protein